LGVDAWSHFGAHPTSRSKNNFFRAKQHVNVWLCAIIFSETSKKNDGLLSNIESLLGITCIVVGVFVINGESKFPGCAALLPTLWRSVHISLAARLRGKPAQSFPSRVFVCLGD